jgi:phage tail sheath gpL-like
MTISFSQIFGTIRTGGSFVEFDGSKATPGLPSAPSRVLLIGQRFNTGLVAALAMAAIVVPDQATAAFGRGSMLDRMAKIARLNDGLTEIQAIALDDLPAGVAATGGTITITGSATAAGVLDLMIAGQQLKISVAAADTPTIIAARIAQVINAAVDLPVTATSALGVATLTARHKGTAGNDIDVRVNYYTGDVLPAGIAVAIVGLSGGTGNPDISAVWAVIGDQRFDTIIVGFDDAATRASLEAELDDRWDAMRQLDGLAYFGARGTQGTLAALGNSRNSPWVSTMGAKDAPNPTYEWAAAYGAVCGFNLAIDPARQMRTLQLKGILAPAATAEFNRAERELLLRDGISTFQIAAGGKVQIERAITTYQVSDLGFADIAWLDVTTPATLSYFRYSKNHRFLTKYPRHKLADDGTAFGPGQKVMTPSVARGEMLVLGREWEEAGLLENLEQFKSTMIVERDATDRNRLNMLVSTDIVNNLNVLAIRNEFRL